MFKSKLSVEKWAKDKNPVIAFFAISHAMVAREKSEALRQIKERRVYDYQFQLPDLTSWFAMYQSNQPLLAYTRLISDDDSNNAKEILGLYLEFRRVERQLRRHPDKYVNRKVSEQERNDSLKCWEKLCASVFAEIKEEITKKPMMLDKQEKFLNALITDELPLSFYFLVYFPCQLFYGMSPMKLYRKALNGDISAIENLIKLDPLTIHDPAIGYRIQTVRLHGKTNDYENFISAVSKQPKFNYKQISDERKSVKSEHGAQIYYLSQVFGDPLNIPEIRALYDALAQDLDGTLVDTDIKKPEGFDKTVKSKSLSWQKQFLTPEKQK